MACARCHAPLNAWSGPGQSGYRHPLHWATDGHEPVPVPVTDLDTVARSCDLCGDQRPLWTLTGGDVSVLALGEGSGLQHNYGDRWAACAACEYWIAAGKPDKVLDRAAAALGFTHHPAARAHLGQLHHTFLEHLQPDRELITTTAWPPTAITSRELPKVRDRLTQLYAGPHRLQGPDMTARRRRTIGDRLAHARLFWVDDTFTSLAERAATHLPEVTIDGPDLPAPDGLIIWHHPVTARQISAASWTSTGTGWCLTTYRSVGADLDGPVLQRVREHVGWLTPLHTTTVTEGGVLPGDDRTAPLIVTWLLIAQKIAEDVPAEVDPRIRKAYARSQRPLPDVRVVRIRGHAARTAGAAGRPSAGRTLSARVFVSGHWRNQAYGKGRALRRPIYINPFLRGPADQPIHTVTSVRVLGVRRPGADPSDQGAAER